MSPKERVLNERAELKQKLVALEAFRETEFHKTLHVGAQRRLLRQAQIMWDYLDILGDRLEDDFE